MRCKELVFGKPCGYAERRHSGKCRWHLAAFRASQPRHSVHPAYVGAWYDLAKIVKLSSGLQNRRRGALIDSKVLRSMGRAAAEIYVEEITGRCTEHKPLCRKRTTIAEAHGRR